MTNPTTNPMINQMGTKFWFNENGMYHRLDGPAIEYANGNKIWYQKGLPHRLDGPAIIREQGVEEWYHHGALHRIGGPAITNHYGYEEWWVNNQLHRLDGPAKTLTNGTQEWSVYNLTLKINIMTKLTQNLSPIDAIKVYLIHPKMTSKNIEKVTGWDPTTLPTPHQLNSWRTLAGLHYE